MSQPLSNSCFNDFLNTATDLDSLNLLFNLLKNSLLKVDKSKTIEAERMASLVTKESRPGLSAKRKKKKTIKSVLTTSQTTKPINLTDDNGVQLFRQALSKAAGDRKTVIAGINAVRRSILKDEATMCFLADDIRPPIIVWSLSLLSNSKNVPLVSVSELRKLTHELFGFETMALAITKRDGLWAKLEAEIIKKQENSCTVKVVKSSEASEEVIDTTIDLSRDQKRVSVVSDKIRKAVPVQKSSDAPKSDFIPISDNLDDFDENCGPGVSTTVISAKERRENIKAKYTYRAPNVIQVAGNSERKKKGERKKQKE